MKQFQYYMGYCNTATQASYTRNRIPSPEIEMKLPRFGSVNKLYHMQCQSDGYSGHCNAVDKL